MNEKEAQAAATPPTTAKPTPTPNSSDSNNISFVLSDPQRAQAAFRWLLGRK